jgi:hypothetical protein
MVLNPAPASFRPSRRTFLKAGVAGGLALLLVRWVRAPTSSPASPKAFALPLETRAIFAAIIPVMLDGALASGAEAAAARSEMLQAIETTIAGLPPASRDELAELFSLLDFAPTRCLVAGVWSPWPEASAPAIEAFLDRWRTSRFALLRSGYGALHQIVLGAWYAQPRAWPAIGYAGPPSLASA